MDSVLNPSGPTDHEIKTVLRLHEFGIHDRLLKCQITKIVITRIVVFIGATGF